jgi:centromere/kinetochore protein ZW10
VTHIPIGNVSLTFIIAGLGPFDAWVSNAPKIWLNKRRETALDWTRNQLALGVGEPLAATHVETRMVPKKEALIEPPGVTVQEDWNSDWGSDEQNEEEEKEGSGDIPKNRESLDEEHRATEVTPTSTDENPFDEEDAWGLTSDDDEPEPKPATQPDLVEVRSAMFYCSLSASQRAYLTDSIIQKTYSEPLHISSMPGPLYDSILRIYEDGAQLMTPESQAIPIAPAAPSLFGLPTLVLAMYRAVSPYHYSNDLSGNMFAYNDAMWLCDRLKTFASNWQARKDLAPRAHGLVKLDPEIRALDSFGKRGTCSAPSLMV